MFISHLTQTPASQIASKYGVINMVSLLFVLKSNLPSAFGNDDLFRLNKYRLPDKPF